MSNIGLDRQICAELQLFATFSMFFLQISKIIVILKWNIKKDYSERVPMFNLFLPRDVADLKEICTKYRLVRETLILETRLP